MNDLTAKLESINARIAGACAKVQRPVTEVRILAVSKRQTVAAIRQLHAAGQFAFAENYLQEALEKQAGLQDLALEWHFIGPVQSNKTQEIANSFSWVQSIDREKIASRLSRQRPGGMPRLNVCIQVNIDREEQKSGANPDEVLQLARLASALPGLSLRGLMAIPRASSTPDQTLQSFRNVKRLFDQLRDEGLPVDTLSMGMSADLELAVAAGSTMVRIGTDLFGPRA
ncbi:MAG: YggS family pyridoxal phosphate-dependent enzyme [Xanthomonadales bacterium]|nr:YggS family pyridoxal phosphate-dependent enzyme [Xanthomonadales bacterium]